MEHGRRARGETDSSVGSSQVLEFGIWGDFGRKIVNGNTGVKTVGVDLVKVSQAGWTTQRLGVQHPKRNKKE